MPLFAKDSPQWLAALQAFQQWLAVDGDDVRIVYAPGEGAAGAAEQLHRLASTTYAGGMIGSASTIFVFDRLDCRYRSVEAMLSTALIQICNGCIGGRSTEATREAIKFLDICGSWLLEDLYAAFSGLVLELLAADREQLQETAFTVVLGNLDSGVPSADWLVRKFSETLSDCGLKFKVVITSSDPEFGVSESGSANTSWHAWDSPAIGLAVCEEKGVERAGEAVGSRGRTSMLVRNGVLALLQAQPELHSCIATLNLLGKCCENDTKLWGMVTKWLRHVQVPDEKDPSEDAWNGFLSKLVPLTPNGLFTSILASVPRQEHAWLTGVLEHVLFAFRPLTLSELFDLRLLPRPSTIGKEKVERCCGGLLMVQGQEVRLAHPDLREYLVNREGGLLGGWFHLRSEASIHESIVESCLRYLADPTNRHLMQHRASPSGSWHTAFDHHDTLLFYAVKYWVRHALLAADKSMNGVFKDFLADRDAVQLWATLYRASSPPLPAARGPVPSGPLSALVILAEHGAENLFSLARNELDPGPTPDRDTAFFAAWVAATAQGNTRIVKELADLGVTTLEGRTLDQPLLAAIESGDETTFSATFAKTARRPRDTVRDLATLLARAASLGHATAVKALLSMNDTATRLKLRVNMGGSDISPLSYACQRGFVNVAELLIRELAPGVDLKLLPVQLAVKSGQLNVFNTVISAAPEQPQDPKTIAFYRSVIQAANRFGRREPVKRFLASIKHRLRRGGSDGPVNDAAPKHEDETDDTGMLADYLAEITGHSQYRDAVTEAIRFWPQAPDLLDVLTQPRDKIREDEFPSALAEWVKEAARASDVRTLKLVFHNGAKSPYATREVLQTAATQAFQEAVIQNRSSSCMSFLVEEGADIKSKAYAGDTALMHALYEGSAKAVEVLLGAKVDVNASGDGIWYPIHLCYRNAEFTRLLVAAGANVNQLSANDESDSEPKPSLYFAVAWGPPDVVDELLKGNPSRETLKLGLDAAAVHQKTELVEKLMAHCPDASYFPDFFLHRQVISSNLEIVKRLLDYPYKMDPKKQDQNDNTVLHYVSGRTSAKLVEMLVKRGADVEATNKIGETALATAVRLGNLDVARYLVQECNALVNVGSKTSYGSPFHEACNKGTLEMVKLLHASKKDPADVNRTARGTLGTPLQAALQRPNNPDNAAEKDAIIRYLVEEAHAKVNQASKFWGGALHVACLCASPETVRMLIDRDANVHAKDHVDRTPLHFAMYRTREHVDALMEKNVDFDAVDVLGRNMLHCAVLSGRADLVRFVLEKRPNFVVGDSLIFRVRWVAEEVTRADAIDNYRTRRTRMIGRRCSGRYGSRVGGMPRRIRSKLLCRSF